MKILVCHNFYQQPGGEDRVFADESRLLEERGHEVVRFTRHNDELAARRPLAVAAGTVWSRRAHRELTEIIRRHRPDVAHFHNTFPQISPAGYHAVRALGVPVVQTLHNYRLLCPNALFFRDGRVCEDCMGRAVAWPGVLHRCYRDSLGASAAITTMLAVHRAAGTWWKQVNRYIALTEFVRRKFVAGGFPRARIVVKPHFLSEDPGVGCGQGGYALFVGRLTREKGVSTLLTAWRSGEGLPPLKVAGDGPLADEVRAAADAGVLDWLGWVSPGEVAALMADAVCLVVPSEWYETFGLVIMEALAIGTPVVVSGGGAAAELVDHGRTGAHFRNGDPADLACQVRALVAVQDRLNRMRAAARAEYETRYSADANYRALLKIYGLLIGPEACGNWAEESPAAPTATGKP